VLAVQTVAADAVMAADGTATFAWRIVPKLASGDFTVAIADLTPQVSSQNLQFYGGAHRFVVFKRFLISIFY